MTRADKPGLISIDLSEPRLNQRFVGAEVEGDWIWIENVEPRKSKNGQVQLCFIVTRLQVSDTVGSGTRLGLRKSNIVQRSHASYYS